MYITWKCIQFFWPKGIWEYFLLLFLIKNDSHWSLILPSEITQVSPFIPLLKNPLQLWHYQTLGIYDWNKHESTIPENFSTQVSVLSGPMVFEKMFFFYVNKWSSNYYIITIICYLYTKLLHPGVSSTFVTFWIVSTANSTRCLGYILCLTVA